MKSSSEEKARLRTLLSNAISDLCRNNLGLIDLQFSVEALIGITVDNEDVMVVSFKETVLPDGAAVSYIWQKEMNETKPRNDEDLQIDSNALFSADELNNAQTFASDQHVFEEFVNPADMKIKCEKESTDYDNYSHNPILSDAYDMNSSSPQIMNYNTSNKRRKQSVPIKVYNETLDCEVEEDKLESKSSGKRRSAVDQGCLSPIRWTKGSGQYLDSAINGESKMLSENYSVPFKQSAYTSLNISRSLKRSASRTESDNFVSIQGVTNALEYADDLSPNNSLAKNEQDVYSSHAENYTYQVLNSTHHGGAVGKRRKHVANSSIKNMSEQDSLIISELLPYLYDQHRPMLIPPTVTQFAPKKRCRVCYSKKIRKEVRYCCYGCSDHPGLCLDSCFYQFHLVRGCAHPKPTESINYSQEVPSDNDCLQTAEACSSYHDATADMT